MILSPFEAGFRNVTLGPSAWKDPWFLMNRIIDVIFLFDMILQFFVAFQMVDSLGGRGWIMDLRKSARWRRRPSNG